MGEDDADIRVMMTRIISSNADDETKERDFEDGQI